MKVINLFGGPGTGKSTTAAHLFALMKQKSMNVELVREYAKDVVWAENFNTLANQFYISAKQYNRQFILNGKVDYIITDSPLLMGKVYMDKKWHSIYGPALDNIFDTFDNINIFLKRVKDYNPAGRVQSEEKARELDDIIVDMLFNSDRKFNSVPADEDAAQFILEIIGA